MTIEGVDHWKGKFGFSVRNTGEAKANQSKVHLKLFVYKTCFLRQNNSVLSYYFTFNGNLQSW